MCNKETKDKDEQKEIMREWFFSKYENPAESCPYDGREGGYQYIYGGPYYAEDILNDEFINVFSEDVINELVDELNSECIEWSAIPTSDWYSDYEYMVKDAYQNFIDHIAQINKLTNIDIGTDSELKNSFFKMIFVSVITSMETYLKDTFIIKLFGSDTYINNLLQNNAGINEKKYSLKKIKEDSDFLNNKIKEYLSSIMWHNLKKVSGLYKEAFDTTLCLNKNLIDAVEKRHDIVHRNGKTKDDIEFKISKEDVINLKNSVSIFVKTIENSFNTYQ